MKNYNMKYKINIEASIEDMPEIDILASDFEQAKDMLLEHLKNSLYNNELDIVESIDSFEVEIIDVNT